MDFYTPKSIVNLIAEMIEPCRGKIYGLCCGSGGGDEYETRKQFFEKKEKPEQQMKAVFDEWV